MFDQLNCKGKTLKYQFENRKSMTHQEVSQAEYQKISSITKNKSQKKQNIIFPLHFLEMFRE